MARPGTAAVIVAAAVLAVTAVPARDLDPVSVEARLEYLLRRSDAGTVPTPMLVAMLRDPYPETRIFALRVVAAAADPNQALLLPEFLADRDFRVRYQAMVAAGRFGPKGLAVALTGLGDPIARVRQAAAWAACHGGDEALKPLLARLEREPDLGVEATAVANLWRFGPGPWLDAAVAAAADPEPQLRRAAAYALGRDDRPGARAALRRLAS
ncbi:MAG TPA: HEAT repeat domain-containing protein, partial [Candidatus Sulfomarinibacteraceae bacterium]|nr:HEAT repeat domain-containing protein [Candidatus Sulfomarinibacteraceae bacterium]